MQELKPHTHSAFLFNLKKKGSKGGCVRVFVQYNFGDTGVCVCLRMLLLARSCVIV